MNSRHYIRDRQNREEIISKIGLGEAVATIRVDRGHPKGPELHTITTTGIIIIRNERSHKIVTKLIARPGQIKRYFTDNEIIPTGLLDIARQHQRLNYNYA